MTVGPLDTPSRGLGLNGRGMEGVSDGDPIRVPYGEKLVLRRQATVTRAGALERAFTRLLARLELTELYEVSFSSGSKL